MPELITSDIPSTMKALLPGDDIDDNIEESFSEMKEIIDQYTEKGSGFIIHDISRIDIFIARYKRIVVAVLSLRYLMTTQKTLFAAN